MRASDVLPGMTFVYDNEERSVVRKIASSRDVIMLYTERNNKVPLVFHKGADIECYDLDAWQSEN